MNKKIIGIIVTSLLLITIIPVSTVNSESIETNTTNGSNSYCQDLQDQIDNLMQHIDNLEYYLYECIWKYFVYQENYHGDFEEYFNSLTYEEMGALEESVNNQLIYLQLQLLILQQKQSLFCKDGGIIESTSTQSTQTIVVTNPLTIGVTSSSSTQSLPVSSTSSTTSSETNNACPCTNN